MPPKKQALQAETGEEIKIKESSTKKRPAKQPLLGQDQKSQPYEPEQSPAPTRKPRGKKPCQDNNPVPITPPENSGAKVKTAGINTKPAANSQNNQKKPQPRMTLQKSKSQIQLSMSELDSTCSSSTTSENTKVTQRKSRAVRVTTGSENEELPSTKPTAARNYRSRKEPASDPGPGQEAVLTSNSTTESITPENTPNVSANKTQLKKPSSAEAKQPKNSDKPLINDTGLKPSNSNSGTASSTNQQRARKPTTTNANVQPKAPGPKDDLTVEDSDTTSQPKKPRNTKKTPAPNLLENGQEEAAQGGMSTVPKCPVSTASAESEAPDPKAGANKTGRSQAEKMGDHVVPEEIKSRTVSKQESVLTRLNSTNSAGPVSARKRQPKKTFPVEAELTINPDNPLTDTAEVTTKATDSKTKTTDMPNCQRARKTATPASMNGQTEALDPKADQPGDKSDATSQLTRNARTPAAPTSSDIGSTDSEFPVVEGSTGKEASASDSKDDAGKTKRYQTKKVPPSVPEEMPPKSNGLRCGSSSSEKKRYHAKLLAYLDNTFTEKETSTLVLFMIHHPDEILPGRMKGSRDINKVLQVLCDSTFISPGYYRKFYDVLKDCFLDNMARDLETKANKYFGTNSLQ